MAEEINRSRHESLELLKPVCMSMMQDCTKTNISKFIYTLAKVKRDVAQEIQQYILFPLQNAMHQKNLSESSFCDVCSALDSVLEKTTIQKTQMFLDIFNPIIYYLSSPTNPSQVSNRLEETKTAAVNTFSTLVQASSSGVLNDIYSLSYLPVIGQLVSILLTLAELERSRSLQIVSMECLTVIMQLDSKYGSTREVHLGNYFAFCLPGVTMAMSRIIIGDMKQGSDVIKKAMAVWSKAVCLIMSDCNLEQARTKSKGKSTVSGGRDKLQSLMIERNEDWVKTTASKLKILVDPICKLGSHSNWRVRLSLAELAESILVHCNKSLSDCVSKLLESLVSLINDEYEKVASKAFSVVQTFSNNQMGLPGERSLTEMLEDNIHNLATSLPRQIRMCDEEEKLPLINLLKGYIMLLGPNIRCVTNSSSHLRHLAVALVQILELDAADGKILEERATLLDYESETFEGEGSHVWKPKKYFKHFRDETILTALISVCQLLGKYGNIYILVDCFLDLYHESSVYKLASILIINEIVLGAGKNDEKGMEEEKDISFVQAKCENKTMVIRDVIRMLVDEYVCTVSMQDASPSHTSHTPSTPSLVASLTLADTHKAGVSTANRNKEILLSCFFMEGLGKFASVLGQDFSVFLIHTLYPLVENLGHENIPISSTAFDTLAQICSACGYRSLDCLIQDNADYLINSVSLCLRHFHQNQRTPRLLCVMLKYCSENLLPLVEHSIGEILDTLDDHYTDDLVLFMPVLLELTSAIGRWFPSTTPTKESDQVNREKPTISIVSNLEEYVRLKRVAEGELTDEDDKDQGMERERTLEDIEEDLSRLKKEKDNNNKALEEEEMEEEEEDKRRECPKHIQVVKEVLSRVKNLLSSHDARIRVQSLEVVAQSCRDLASHERELLPQIHQAWPGFYPRFHSEEKFVIIQALHTLRVMTDVSGSFVLQRVMKDVVPGLSQFMDKQADISCDSRSSYVNTASCRLQLAILNTLGPLAERLELRERNLDIVAKICLPYLSHLQPDKLQKASVSSFKSFVSLDSDAVWLLLCQVYCPRNYQLPGTEFTQLPKSLQKQQENSYTKNVTEIYEHFYSL